MAGASKKKRKKTIFESIRKPTAPPARKMGERKPDEAAHPANRTAKHKRRDDEDADL